MNSRKFMTRDKRGSLLVMTMMAAFIMAVVIAGILTYSSRMSHASLRRVRWEQARLAATNELEHLFFRWANGVNQVSAQSAEYGIFNAGLIENPDPATAETVGTQFLTTSPFLANALNTYPAIPALNLNRGLRKVKLSALGEVQSQTSGVSRTGNVKFWNAKVRAQIVDPIVGTVEARLGRRFTLQTLSATNGAIYYQRDMEYGVGGNMDIYGDILCNGNIYLGSRNGTLTIHDKIYYLNNFNGSANNTSGTQRTIDPNPPAHALAYNDGVFSTSRASQVVRMNGAENMLGFGDANDPTADPNYIATGPYAAAYPNGVNDVYRALIAPPPTDASGNPVAEDPRVKESRTYHKAGLRVKIGPGTSITVVDPATNAAPPGLNLTNVITSVRSPVWDQREGKTVNMTTVDMGQLAAAIRAAEQNSTWRFNGVFYIHDENPQGTTLNGIRIVNGTTTPNFDYNSTNTDANDEATGFTFCTDNGLYIQGDYNTAVNPTTSETNRASVMADAVTILSAGWDDSKSSLPLDPSNPSNSRTASGNVTIKSAIMSGNTPTQTDASGNYVYDAAGRLLNSSGGVQNLARFLEDWYYPNLSVTINGSLVQLFYSRYFNSSFQPSGTDYNVYIQPRTRRLEFDYALAANPPNGVPNSTTRYSRGELFEW
jgi:hypothetical protein